MIKMCTPQRGDIVELSYNPIKYDGKPKRPAVVISDSNFFNTSGKLLVCMMDCVDLKSPPNRKYIRISDKPSVSWVILADEIKTIDLAKKQILYLDKADKNVVSNVINTVAGFFRF